MGNVINLNSRRAERKQVEWAAVARRGDLMLRGTIRDWTPYGMFFEPEIGYDQGFVSGLEALREVVIGGHFEVTVEVGSVASFVFDMAVRWAGESQKHNCHGFGAECIAEPMKLAA